MSDSAELPPFLKQEAQGDASGFKGSHYHLLYCARELLTGNAREMTFYAGNDLVGRRVAPPGEIGPEEVCLIGSLQLLQDEWIQLKNEAGTWTANRLTTGNLLPNFVADALLSQHRGRRWTVKLVSPGSVDAEGIASFLADKTSQPDTKRKFDAAVERAHSEWNSWLTSEGVTALPGLHDVEQIADQVLAQLAHSSPVSTATLQAEVRLALTERLVDPLTVQRCLDALLGAVSSAAGESPGEPFSLTITWFERRTDYRLRAPDELDRDVLSACRIEVERNLPEGWSPAVFAPRPDLTRALEEFEQSDWTLFALTGESGSGKSWAVAAHALQRARQRVSALVAGRDLMVAGSLGGAITKEFRSLTRVDAADEGIIRSLLGAAQDPERGPVVLVADDLPLEENVEQQVAKLASICREGKNQRVKIIVALRHNVWRRLAAERELGPYLFRRTSLGSGEIAPSYDIRALTYAEIQGILERRLPLAAPTGNISLQLRQPGFSALRNPYLLSLYIRLRLGNDFGAALQPVDVDELLNEEVQQRVALSVRRVGCERDELQRALDGLIERLWGTRRAALASGQGIAILDKHIPGFGRPVLDALRTQDILTPTGDPKAAQDAIAFANPQLGDLLTARWLTKRLAQNEAVAADLEPGEDDGVVVTLLRSAIDGAVADPLSWAEALLTRDSRWLTAVAQGLASRRDVGWRTVALLTSWANRSERKAAWTAMTALGTAAPRSSIARKWIVGLYFDTEPYHRLNGEMAMSSAFEFAPEWVDAQVRERLKRDVAVETRTSSALRRRADAVHGALLPLHGTNHEEAARAARSILDWLEQEFGSARWRDANEVRNRVDDAVAAIRGQIAVYGPPAELGLIIDELDAEDWRVRFNAADALLPVVHQASERARADVFRRTAREEHEGVLSRLLHLLFFYIDSYPDDVLKAIEQSRAVHTRGAGLALVLLARLARAHPAQVHGQLSESLVSLTREAQALHLECLAFTWWQYAAAAPADRAAREVLERLSRPDYSDLKNEFRVFAARGAAVSALGRVGLDIPEFSAAAGAEDTFFHPRAVELGEGAMYVDATEVLARFATEIVAHPLGTEFVLRLCETLSEFKAHEEHPIHELVSSRQFRIAQICSQWLCRLVVHL